MSSDCLLINPMNVSLLAGDLLALAPTAFQPELIAWSERLYESLIESIKEQARLASYTRTRIGLWSASYATALEENLSWQATTAQGLCQVMKPEVLAELTASWKKKGVIASAVPVCLP